MNKILIIILLMSTLLITGCNSSSDGVYVGTPNTSTTNENNTNNNETTNKDNNIKNENINEENKNQTINSSNNNTTTQELCIENITNNGVIVTIKAKTINEKIKGYYFPISTK